MEGALTKAYNEAVSKHEAAKKEFLVAGKGGDITAMLSAGRAVEAAEREVNKCKLAVDQAQYAAKNAARDTAKVALQNSIQSFLGTLDIVSFPLVDISGFGVLFVDGGATVSVQTKSTPGSKAPGKTTSSGKQRAKTVWTLAFDGGREIKSRALLLEFGGQIGADAVAAVDAAAASGANNPGWQKQLDALATSMGYTGGVDRVLMQRPGQ